MTDQRAKLDWRNGVPIAAAFDDPYYSLDDGVAETTHVFLGGNELPARFGGDFHVAELGFGTGLNFLVTWAAWEAAGAAGTLHFTSFEAFPMALADMRNALAQFPQLQSYSDRLLAVWGLQEGPVAVAPRVTLHVVTGDARETVPLWGGQADAWYLDGFSPAKNPELWEPGLLSDVGAHTKPDGTAATYSAAGHIRRALQDAGFTVTRTTGFGRKRHMTAARMADAE